MTEHDQRACLPRQGESEDPRPAEGVIIELGGGAAQPPEECARLEDVLTPKHVDAELEACMRADAAGDPQGATNVGVLLEEGGDLQGALAAYRRADRRGDVNGSFNLGCLLAEMGDLPGAQEALRRADERGDGAAASNLGVLLERQGDLEGALAAYRRGDERGDALAAFNLGLLLAARGEAAGARAAYRRAAERGDPEVGERAAEAEAGLTVEAPQVTVSEAERHETSRTGWIVAVCLLALVAIVITRGRRRGR